MLLNIHINHKAYYGRGEGGMEVEEEGYCYTYCYTVTTRMTSALRSVGSDVRAILTFH